MRYVKGDVVARLNSGGAGAVVPPLGLGTEALISLLARSINSSRTLPKSVGLSISIRRVNWGAWGRAPTKAARGPGGPPPGAVAGLTGSAKMAIFGPRCPRIS